MIAVVTFQDVIDQYNEPVSLYQISVMDVSSTFTRDPLEQMRKVGNSAETLPSPALFRSLPVLIPGGQGLIYFSLARFANKGLQEKRLNARPYAHRLIDHVHGVVYLAWTYNTG